MFLNALQNDSIFLSFLNFSTFREVSELVVSIIQARDLTANQYSGSLDTYIRGILLPDSESRFQTKVINKIRI